MRTKALLFLMFLTCGIVSAQVDDTIRSLVISEIRIDDARRAYVEVSNVGEVPSILAISRSELCCRGKTI